MSLINTLLDKLAPHDCVGCGEEGSLLCSACTGCLISPPLHPELTNLRKLHSAVLYEGVAKDLIWKLKSAGTQSAAQIMAKHMAGLVPDGRNWLIVPVPTATTRVRQRGYDQAKLLARAIARKTGLDYANCLARQGQAHQVGASRQARRHQLEGALRVRKAVRGAYIVLIDDVTTTGATLEAAAAALKQAGAYQIEAVTFAYKPKNS